jgi:hypothetical protein
VIHNLLEKGPDISDDECHLTFYLYAATLALTAKVTKVPQNYYISAYVQWILCKCFCVHVFLHTSQLQMVHSQSVGVCILSVGKL